MNPFSTQSPDSIVNILESFPTYGLAMKFVQAFCIRGIKGLIKLRLQRKFLQYVSKKKIKGTKLCGEWHSIDAPNTLYDSTGLIIKMKVWHIKGAAKIFDNPNLNEILKPSIVEYYDNGKVQSKTWAHNTGWFIVKYWHNGKVQSKTWEDDDHKLCRYPAAAEIKYYETGELEKKRYLHKNRMTKEVITYHKNGQTALHTKYDRKGQTHCSNGPACIQWNEQGKILYVKWIKHGRYYNRGYKTISWEDDTLKSIHVENDEIYWQDNGTVRDETQRLEIEGQKCVYHVEYFRNGNVRKLFIENHIVIKYHRNGQILKEKWFQKGKISRTDDAAVIYYDRKGKRTEERWFWEGKPWNAPDKKAIVKYS